jgi:uncharacterized protein YxjI
MELKCIKGSISCDGVRVKKGETFEVCDTSGKILVESRFAVEIVRRSDDIATKQVKDIMDSEDTVGLTETEVSTEVTDEQTREHNGVLQHKHFGFNHWHPIERVHELTSDG